MGQPHALRNSVIPRYHLVDQLLFLLLYVENLAMVHDYPDPRKQLHAYLSLDRVFSNELVDVNRLFLANPVRATPLAFGTKLCLILTCCTYRSLDSRCLPATS